MNLRSLFAHTRLITGLWLLTLTVPIASHAAMLSMEYSIGFDGFVQLDKWTPVLVVMENRGRPLSGTLEVLATSGSEYRGDVYQTTYAREMELPYRSRKRFAFTVLIRSVTHDLLIRFREGEEILVSTAVNLKHKVISKDAALVLDDGISADFLSSLPPQIFPVRVSANQLPDTWYGYDGVRMVIFNPAMLKRLDDRQFQAMERWVNDGGGYLITSAGMNYGAFREDRMTRLLPVQINGHRHLLDPAALEKFSDQKLTGPDPLLVVNAEIKDSETLATANGIPLIVQKRAAHGMIVFLSFDIQSPVFSRWTGRQGFWEKILRLAPMRQKARSTLSDQQIIDAMLSGIQLKFPPFWPAASLLLIYTAGIGMLLKRAGARKESRKRCTTILLLGIAFFIVSGGGYFFWKDRMNRLTLNSLCLLNGTGRHLSGFGKYILGAYSIGNTEFRVGFSDTSYPISYLLADGSGKKIPNPYTLIESPAGQQIKTESPKWSYNLFRTESKTDLPMAAHGIIRNKALHLTLENSSSHAIRNGLLYFKGRFFQVGPIAARNTTTITIDADRLFTENETEKKDLEALAEGIGPKRVSSFFDAMAHRLIKDLLPQIHSTAPANSDRLRLIGWIRAAVIEPNFNDPAIQSDGMTLIEWEIPIER